MTAWIDHHLDRLGHDLKTAEFIKTGTIATWHCPDMLARRCEALPDSYLKDAMRRLSEAAPDLPDLDAYFAAVCLCSLSAWSVRPVYARPAADLLADRDVPALRRLLSAHVLTSTQSDRAPRGRAGAGTIEELRDLGMAIISLAAESKKGFYGRRRTEIARANWSSIWNACEVKNVF